MIKKYKIGGGNKMQPYIPAGNGEKSGEYTKNNTINFYSRSIIGNCYIENTTFSFNFYKSKLVGKVKVTCSATEGFSIPKQWIPNSVAKKLINNYIVSERYYNSKGEPYLDIDYTCHGNLKKHPCVPHIHRWSKNKNGILERGEWEVFK